MGEFEGDTARHERAWLSQRIAEATDREALRALDAHLLTRPEPWARALRFTIGARAAKIRVQVAPPLLAARGLPAPDGRWLYRYRLDDAGFVNSRAITTP